MPLYLRAGNIHISALFDLFYILFVYFSYLMHLLAFHSLTFQPCMIYLIELKPFFTFVSFPILRLSILPLYSFCASLFPVSNVYTHRSKLLQTNISPEPFPTV